MSQKIEFRFLKIFNVNLWAQKMKRKNYMKLHVSNAKKQMLV